VQQPFLVDPSLVDPATSAVPLQLSPASSSLDARQVNFLRVYAWRLADSRINRWSSREQCMDCGVHQAIPEDPIQHAADCRVGNVFRTLAALDGDEESAPEDALMGKGHPPGTSRESDLAGLILEARNLAWSRIISHVPRVVTCHDCAQHLSEDGLEGHQPTCHAGKVLRRLAALSEHTAAAARRVLTPVSGSSLPGTGFFGEPKNYNEPWKVVDGPTRDEYETLIVDRNGTRLADLHTLDAGASVERQFANRIRACVTFCAGFATEYLDQIVEKYGIRNFAIMAYDAAQLRISVLATVRAMIDEDARQRAVLELPEDRPRGEDALYAAAEAPAPCAAPACACDQATGCESLPSVEDLDRVAEEQRVAAITARPCVWCDEGNPAVVSSVSEAFVHTNTPVGRVICKRRTSDEFLDRIHDPFGAKKPVSGEEAVSE
jgi:hypothetical protein